MTLAVCKCSYLLKCVTYMATSLSISGAHPQPTLMLLDSSLFLGKSSFCLFSAYLLFGLFSEYFATFLLSSLRSIDSKHVSVILSLIPESRKGVQNSKQTKLYLLEKLHLGLTDEKKKKKPQCQRIKNTDTEKGLETLTHRKQDFASTE